MKRHRHRFDAAGVEAGEHRVAIAAYGVDPQVERRRILQRTHEFTDEFLIVLFQQAVDNPLLRSAST